MLLVSRCLQAAQERGGVFTPLHHFHERGAHDDAVDGRAHALNLLAAANAETRTHRDG